MNFWGLESLLYLAHHVVDVVRGVTNWQQVMKVVYINLEHYSPNLTINIDLDLNTPSQLATHNETSSQWTRRLGSLGDLKPVPHTLQTWHIPCKPLRQHRNCRDPQLSRRSRSLETTKFDMEIWRPTELFNKCKPSLPCGRHWQFTHCSFLRDPFNTHSKQ